jgi:antitoxin component of MazEF toxin-antitoxin module
MEQSILDLGLRKIQLIRGSAFINLPRAWIRTNHLCKGDKLKIALRNDGTLEMSCFVASEEGGDA